ncbi:MAG: hypothetical protein R2799_09295 [Crocinitomicaceae bacterium]
MMKGLAIIAVFVTATAFVVKPASGPVSEYYVEYDVTFDSDDPQMEQAMPFLAGSVMKIFKNSKFTKTVFKTGTVSTQTTTIDNKTKKGIAVTESMMGNFYTMLDGEEDDKDPEVEIEKTSETKDILGFNCTKYIVSGGAGGEIEVWSTTEIEGEFVSKWVPKSGKMEGFPLQITVEMEQMSISMTAKDYKSEIPKSEEFSLKPPKGYDEKSAEDIQKMGGM